MLWCCCPEGARSSFRAATASRSEPLVPARFCSARSRRRRRPAGRRIPPAVPALTPPLPLPRPGYGHISPATRYGRLFCVLYSLVGVPLTCILMAYSSEMLSNRMLQLYTSARVSPPSRSAPLTLRLSGSGSVSRCRWVGESESVSVNYSQSVTLSQLLSVISHGDNLLQCLTNGPHYPPP